MRELGLDAYRFSIAWPRVLPHGQGSVNEPGLDFYDKLVDALLAAGITPYATLYHWDLPQALQENGGWVNRETANAFAEYTDVVARRLGDRVHYWITHNEPAVAAFHGHMWGEHAPGARNPIMAYQAAHYLLLSHGLATQALRAVSPDARVGITLNLFPSEPASNSPEDVAALAERRLPKPLVSGPVFHARYPDDILRLLGSYMPKVREGDMAHYCHTTTLPGN